MAILIVLLGPANICGCAPSPDAPSPPPVSVAVSANGNRVPGDVLDLENWYLTLPRGEERDPDTVHQPDLAAYRSSYFRLNKAKNGVVFTADAGGATTSGSNYPRSELREMNGTEKASWSNTHGTHTLSVRQAVTALPQAKPHVVTAQIHDASDDVIQVRLEGTHLMTRYADGQSEITIDPDYVLGTVFDVKIVAADSRVEVYYNDALKAEINQGGSEWYFKCGSYLQSNTGKGDAADAVGEVVIYSLRMTHSG